MKIRREGNLPGGLSTAGRMRRRVEQYMPTAPKQRRLRSQAGTTPVTPAITAIPAAPPTPPTPPIPALPGPAAPTPTAGGSGAGNSRRRQRTGSGDRQGQGVGGKRRRLSTEPQPSTSTAASGYGFRPRRLSKATNKQQIYNQPDEQIIKLYDEQEEAERLENDVNQLLCTFGDCDPDYVRDKMKQFKDHSDRFELVKNHLLNEKYPTLKEKLIQKYATEKLNNLLSLSTDQLIEKFAQEEDLFLQESRKRKSDGKTVYLNHAVALVANHCRLLPVPHIRNIVRKQEDVITAYRKLNAENERRLEAPRAYGRRGTYLKKPREVDVPAPPEPLPEFRWDSLYIDNLCNIQEYKESRAASKTLRYMQAKSAGQLVECPICLDLVLPEDMLGCPAGHQACKGCLHQTVTQQAGLGRAAFPCLFPDCDELLDLQVLLQALPRRLYRALEGRVQGEEVRRANVPGLVSCPHCYFAVIFPEEGQRDVLQCENPDCLATTCRFCQSDAHVLLTCEQRAKKRLQLYVENKMSAAVIRQCPDCGMAFVKGGGCNRMECPKCHAAVCYGCGERLGTNGYAHFTTAENNSRCKVLDEFQIHRVDLQEAIPKAEAEFRETHRAAEGVTLDVDYLADWVEASMNH